ncbi:MAG: cysteine desulfurase family protein [Minisyncoccia bacterium]
MTNKIYLDYAASTPLEPLVLQKMKKYFFQDYGNPESLHCFGQKALNAIDIAREYLAQVTNSNFRNIIFTSGATEANNLALRGVIKAFKKLNKNFIPEIMISAIEHKSILKTADDLKFDAKIITIPVNKNGYVDLNFIKQNINSNTILISIMYVNNETGNIQPLDKITTIINNFKKNNNSLYPLFHSDAAQAFYYLPCNIQKLKIDLMTISAQKIYGPKGIGALIFNPNSKIIENKLINPIITGGNQEFNLRAGTENTPLIFGFYQAAQLAIKNQSKNYKYVQNIKNYFIHQLQKSYPIKINGSSDIPHIVNIYFPNNAAEDLIIKLDSEGIAVAASSACTARSLTPSHVLQAMNLNQNILNSSLRFSFSPLTTKQELNYVLKKIKKIIF